MHLVFGLSRALPTLSVLGLQMWRDLFGLISLVTAAFLKPELGKKNPETARAEGHVTTGVARGGHFVEQKTVA